MNRCIRQQFVILITLQLLQHITATSAPSKIIRELPQKVLIGYTSGHNYTKVKEAIVNDGVNMVIWSFIDIVATPTTPNNTTVSSNLNGHIRTNLDLQTIASFMHQLDIDGYSNIIHLTSFGGWNGPHLDTTLSAHEWYDVWQNSNASKIFHGIDFDLEGNDNLTSTNNVFTIDCLDLMGSISTLMNDNGYIVSIAPPLSYLNFINNSNFSRYVNISIPNRSWHSDFHYFGSNVYAYLLAKYGNYIDLISIQLYESYSDAGMSIYHDGVKPSDYLYNFVHDLVVNNESYHVKFDQDTTLGMKAQNVSVPLSKLVIGLANGWAVNNNPDSSSYHKALYISGTECEVAYKRLLNDQHVPRGFMFWTIEERGKNDIYLAKDIGRFLFFDNNYTSKPNGHDNKKKDSNNINNNTSRIRGSHHYILGTMTIIGLSIYCYVRRYDIRSVWVRVIDHYHDYVSSLEESGGQQQEPLLDDSSFIFETIR